jgi:sRNA-binding carbon storage regulator CsrA
MLVVSRNVFEDCERLPNDRRNEIVIRCPDGERIVVKVLPGRRGGGQIRVGVDAPARFTVLRGEIEGLHFEKSGEESGLLAVS